MFDKIFKRILDQAIEYGFIDTETVFGDGKILQISYQLYKLLLNFQKKEAYSILNIPLCQQSEVEY